MPAIDVLDGRVVQLVGGRTEAERVSLPDPVGIALTWVEQGFAMLHVVDLDAALGTGANRGVIEDVIRAVDVPVQVGGGVRSDEAADALLASGAARIVVGTRAVEDRDWLEQLAARHPGRVLVAADVRDGRVVSRGWTTETDREVSEFVRTVGDLPLAGVLVTDVAREGAMQGADVVLFEALTEAARQPLFAAGGIAGSADLAALASVGVHAAILGMALYTGALDAPTTARSYHE